MTKNNSSFWGFRLVFGFRVEGTKLGHCRVLSEEPTAGNNNKTPPQKSGKMYRRADTPTLNMTRKMMARRQMKAATTATVATSEIIAIVNNSNGHEPNYTLNLEP